MALAAPILEDLAERLAKRSTKLSKGLAMLIATMFAVRSAGLIDLAALLPREAESIVMRWNWISRLLGDGLIDTDGVIAPYARKVL